MMPFKDPVQRAGYHARYQTQNQVRYRATEKGKAVTARAAKRQRRLHPDREAARHAVSHAIRAGALIRQPCRCCGKKAEAHHAFGYAKENWLNVWWLCKKHHRAIEALEQIKGPPSA
jgi:hypothetical protein